MKKTQRILKVLYTSVLSGAFLAIIVGLYKFFAHHIIHFSEKGFALVRENLWLCVIAVPLLFLASLILNRVYGRYQNLKGSGIPNAVLAARGKISLSSISDTVGMFFLSLVSFLFGIPLGNEGPCVQMGAALSSGVSKLFHKDDDLKGDCIAAGACAGFAAATGAPFAGVAFLFDEISRRPKPLLVISSAVSSLVCAAILRFVCPFLKVEAALLPRLSLPAFSLKDIWIALLVGVVFGIFSIIFLKSYKALRIAYIKLFSKGLGRYKIFFVLALTLAAGLISASFVSTGHGFSVELMNGAKPLFALAVILIVRSFLSISANANSVCGGTFVPLIAVGVVAAAMLASSAYAACGEGYYQLFFMLSITATISGMMKMPLVSVLFALEIFHCPQYILYIILVAAISYFIPELLKIKSINEIVIDEKE